jgi:F-type H+-transporting ATPase subunit gamma
MSLLDLRRRIKSIKNTQKITRAMQLVAASKMKKAQEAALAGRPYAEELAKLIENLLLHIGTSQLEHPFFLRRENPKKIAYILFTADRGLCGAFNSNIIRYLARAEVGAGQSKHLICVGRKGLNFFKRFSELEVTAEFSGLGDKPKFLETVGITKLAIDGFLKGEFDEVRVVYNHFVSTMNQEITEKVLLPFTAPERDAKEQKAAAKMDYLFEPSAESVLDRLLPRYLETQIWQSLLESNASEQSARMIAMKSATDNAKELNATLTLEMNKARQTQITTEISEIVGGAEALA